MEIRKCPKCELRNTGTAWNCYYCGQTLSMKSIIEVEENVGKAFDIMDNFYSGESTESKLRQLDKLSKIRIEIMEIPRFLKIVSEKDNNSEVRVFAKEKLKQMDTVEENIKEVDASNQIVKQALPLKEYDDIRQNENIISAFRFAALILIINAVYMVIVHILTLGFEFQGFLAPVISVILAIFLLENKNWAKILSLVNAIISFLSIIYNAINQTDYFGAIFIMLASLGLPISLGILLIGNITSRRLKIGKIFFFVFSLIPMFCLISVLVLSYFIEY